MLLIWIIKIGYENKLISKLMNAVNTFLSRAKINSSRKYLDDFAKEAASSVKKSALVLDAGAGNCPYKHYFSHTKYESADFFCQVNKDYAPITYVCDLSNIPVDDDKYNLIFCSQTLEHLPEPQRVLNEFFRILKPGGQLWLSAPLFYEEHETPYDFYRYTQFGFTHLLKSSGFRIKRIEWLEGYYGTLSYQLEMASRALPSNPSSFGGGYKGIICSGIVSILKPLFALLSIFFARLDIRSKYVENGQCKNYIVVARKPRGVQRKSEQFWSDLENHSPNWDDRTKIISAMIPPGSSVFEFGAGRLILKAMLDETCIYNHHDLKPRTENTHVFDLNSRPIPEVPNHDFAVFSGVLEYIDDVPSLIDEISSRFPKIITSYVLKELIPSKKKRNKNGWVNSFEEPELVNIFESRGYTLQSSQLYKGRQKIFLFSRSSE